MQTPRFSLRAAAVAIILAVVALSAFAQGNNPKSEARIWIEGYLRYFKFEAKVTPQDVDRLTELRLKTMASATSLEERQAAYKELAVMLFRLAGTNPAPPEPALARFGQNTGQIVHRLLNDPTTKPASQMATPLGQLGQVEKRGRGPVPVILIADVRADWTIYQNFIERNADRYTMYAVTLPGFGGTPAPPRAASLDLAATPWWDGAEQGVLSLIEKNRLNKPMVVGTLGSSYLAARLALRHPEKVRGAVLLDGMVYTTFRSLTNPDYPVTLEERPRVLATQPGAIGMLQEFAPQLMPSRESTETRIKALPSAQIGLLANTRDLERARALAINAAAGSDPRAYRYNTELFSTDLTSELKNLRAPMLVITAVHDDNSPGQGGPGPAEWNEIKLRYPSIPLTVAKFENARSYIMDEAPQELDKAIEAFLASKPVEGRKGRVIAARPSPRASAMQAIGATEIAITYGRPQVNNRKVWGELVPYNRVWRTGANEATTISFSTDVLIEGQKLAAGAYTLSTIPTETEWTIIFNKVTDQWGAFYYNPEFDALRVKVKPQASEHEEWLSYSFEGLSATSARVAIHWEKVKAAFKIELEPAKPSTAGN